MSVIENLPPVLIYDFEVLEKSICPTTGEAWWGVCFLEYQTGKGKLIMNNRQELIDFYNATKDKYIFVGYNVNFYDQWIFKGIITGMNAGYVNSRLFAGEKGYRIVKNGYNIPLKSFDCTTGFHSLKQLEAFMGSRIEESSIPFDIDRPITKEEERELMKYCLHDVKETKKVFEKRIDDFISQLSLIETFNLPESEFNRTKAQLTATILKANKVDRDDEFDLKLPRDVKLSYKYKYIYDWYANPENMDYTKKLEITVAGIPTVLAWGGYHGAEENCEHEGIIVQADVKSKYPTTMIQHNFVSRNVLSPDYFKEIYDTRFKLKAEKNKREAVYKLIMNTCYGAMKDKYNQLYDPRNANNVCVTGQLFLLDLIDKIEPHCQMIQANTDAVLFKVESMEKLEEIKLITREWEVRSKFELDWEIYNKIVQKDVNNYVMIEENGNYKGKGAYVKKLNDLDYDLAIVNKALINYFVKGIKPEDTINECNDLRDFQKVVKLTSAYKEAWKNCTFSKQPVFNEKTGKTTKKNMWDEGSGIPLKEKVYRIFASKNAEDGGLFKKKDGQNPAKWGNTPSSCFIFNGEVLGKPVPEHLDRQWYIDLAYDRIRQFKGEPKPKKNKKGEN